MDELRGALLADSQPACFGDPVDVPDEGLGCGDGRRWGRARAGLAVDDAYRAGLARPKPTCWSQPVRMY